MQVRARGVVRWRGGWCIAGERLNCESDGLPIFFFTRCRILRLFYFFLNHVHNREFWGDGLWELIAKLSHHTPGPGGIASLDPQTVFQCLTLCATTIMRP